MLLRPAQIVCQDSSLPQVIVATVLRAQPVSTLLTEQLIAAPHASRDEQTLTWIHQLRAVNARLAGMQSKDRQARA